MNKRRSTPLDDFYHLIKNTIYGDAISMVVSLSSGNPHASLDAGVKCPVPGCLFKIRDLSTYYKHFNGKHKSELNQLEKMSRQR